MQGAVSEHCNALASVGVEGRLVRTPKDLDSLDALIIPGGESTAISRMITQNGLRSPIKSFAKDKPVMGTCAGLILCAAEITGADGAQARPGAPLVEPLGLMPICAHRNGFGRQVESFEAPLAIEGIGSDIPAVFIRAPYIERAQPEVKILAHVEDKAVVAQYGKVLALSFHPELSDDLRIMEYFCRTA